jgi:hypothetical protein
MSYQYKGKPVEAAGPVLAVEQLRRRNAELHVELQALTAENTEIDKRIRLMRDELTLAYRKLRKQVWDLEAVRAQEQLIAEAKAFESKLPPPRYGGREGLEAATQEMLAHESKGLKLGKDLPAPKGPSHGTTRRYAEGCRCQECRGINAINKGRARLNLRRREQQVAA